MQPLINIYYNRIDTRLHYRMAKLLKITINSPKLYIC